MSRKLVAYFSASGHTAKVAEHLAEAIGADLFEIPPRVRYTKKDLDWQDQASRSSVEMSDPSCRPEMEMLRDNMADYDTVYLGFPIWWYVAPRIINTFLDAYDLSGKTIIPFCTSGSSSIGGSVSDLEALTDGATWLEGQRFSGSASQETVSQWVDSLGLDLGQAA